ncbi:MAG TPA: hypothetical protein VFD43_02625 [Planctomycetota bacterium]|nr:hypothetical protein [Planctomycetota bacterium]
MALQGLVAPARLLPIGLGAITVLAWAAAAGRAPAQSSSSSQYVPPPGTAIATGIKVEQEGDVRAGTPGVGGSATTPLDWADASGGPGLLDGTTFVANPLTPNLPSHKLLISNAHKALLCRDPNVGGNANPAEGIGFDSTLFQGNPTNSFMIGAGQSPWPWSANQNVPMRYDLTNCYVHTRRDACGHTWVLFGVEIRHSGTDFHWDLELSHAGIGLGQSAGNGTPMELDDAGNLVGNGPAGGRTVGDLLLAVNKPAGGQPAIDVHRWTEIFPGSYGWVQQTLPTYDCDGSGATTNDQDFDGTPGADPTAYGRAIMGGGIPGGYWKHFADDGSTTDDITSSSLIECAVDLTAFGVSFDPCSTTGTALFKTRAGGSFNSTLEDFALAPFGTSRFTNLGHALAGTQGFPALGGGGCLTGGSTVTLSLTRARPGASTTLLVGAFALNAPFKGGIMVPNPNLQIFALVTNPAGALTLNGTWPNGLPSGANIYYQFWIPDPLGAVGFAASNGMAATTP